MAIVGEESTSAAVVTVVGARVDVVLSRGVVRSSRSETRSRGAAFRLEKELRLS